MQAVVIAERAVHITTQVGKVWSVLRDCVDVAATLAANQARAPLEVVTIPEAPPVKAPPATALPASTSSSDDAATNPSSSASSRRCLRKTSSDRRSSHPRHYRLAITINGVQGTDTLSFADTNQFELFKEPGSNRERVP